MPGHPGRLKQSFNKFRGKKLERQKIIWFTAKLNVFYVTNKNRAQKLLSLFFKDGRTPTKIHLFFLVHSET